jgi:hypothetical protein
MNPKRRISRIAFVPLIILILSLPACRDIEVMIQEDRYTPSFRSSEYSRYKGKSLYLSSFENKADNTFLWGYQSQDRQVTYKSQVSVLESFFWYCFEKAFRSIGMGVYEQGPPPAGVPEFRFTLISLHDQEFKYKVALFRNGFQLFEKNYTVTMPPMGTENIPELEKRVYKLVDLAFTTILKDPEFSKNF